MGLGEFVLGENSGRRERKEGRPLFIYLFFEDLFICVREYAGGRGKGREALSRLPAER